MNYELAEQLKEAGFPQEGEGKWWDSNANEFQSLSGNKSNFAYEPTLSELIDACDTPFRLVCYTATNWNASDKVTSDGYLGYGSTPEEAVAKLWLVLHSTS